MPRAATTDANAELAVRLYGEMLDQREWGLERAWLAVAELLMTCEVWWGGHWHPRYDAPVLRESNVYGLAKGGQPNPALRASLAVKDRLAEELAVPSYDLCRAIGRFFREPPLRGLQPNNPRGHAFRSLVAETLARFGDPALDVAEAVSPHDVFPDFDPRTAGRDNRIDIVVWRGDRLVALITTHWTYRHTRAGMLRDAEAYMPLARRLNPDCRFFGVTAEFSTPRLQMVIERSRATTPNADIDRLVHLNAELPGEVIGHDGELDGMWSLAEMVEDSRGWR